MIKFITGYKIRDIREEINIFGFSPAFLRKRKIYWIKKLVFSPETSLRDFVKYDHIPAVGAGASKAKIWEECPSL